MAQSVWTRTGVRGHTLCGMVWYRPGPFSIVQRYRHNFICTGQAHYTVYMLTGLTLFGSGPLCVDQVHSVWTRPLGVDRDHSVWTGPLADSLKLGLLCVEHAQ